jgi:hypothetical protein
MLSRMSLKWKWYDWLFVAIVVFIIVGAIRVVAPKGRKILCRSGCATSSVHLQPSLTLISMIGVVLCTTPLCLYIPYKKKEEASPNACRRGASRS